MIRTQCGQLYTGITTDMQRRWHEHLTGKGGARYFRGHTPHKIAYIEQHVDRSQASRREAALKKLSKPAKEALIQGSHIPNELSFANDQ